MKLYFNSKLFQKALAALSGGFLVLFLLGHLAGNLQLFIPGELGQKQFNAYALFMTTNPAVIALSYITYSSIILHSILTIYLVLKSRLARPISNSHFLETFHVFFQIAILGNYFLLYWKEPSFFLHIRYRYTEILIFFF